MRRGEGRGGGYGKREKGKGDGRKGEKGKKRIRRILKQPLKDNLSLEMELLRECVIEGPPLRV